MALLQVAELLLGTPHKDNASVAQQIFWKPVSARDTLQRFFRRQVGRQQTFNCQVDLIVHTFTNHAKDQNRGLLVITDLKTKLTLTLGSDRYLP